ncbi:hypothetical protein BACCIP111899_03469 [Bacillus rhizoplanae]|uniref:Uncharacterized protein n=1 Tax=Bacillus rhizoplanae TaxID=2880966 RepID=A0ABM8YEL9_9BACI|nr:hypothetical protein [Bacillus rhizoplanae]CAG9614242.1 hypothetical protein BACCIP111899_03469 [Bacillus rhizoplanae]
MGKTFTIIGISSIIFVAILLLTCPKEADFQKHLADEYSIVCSEMSFNCTQQKDNKEEKLEFVSSDVRNGVFFMKIEQTFQTETGKKKTYSAIGILGMFLFSSEKTF